MARAKKEKLSLDELLEQIWVKGEDQPYEVPNNWVWTHLGDLLKPMFTKKPNKDEEFFRYIDIEAIDNKRQRISEAKKVLVKDAPSRASREVDCGDTLFSLVRPYLKNIAYVTEEHKDCIASTGFYVCKPKDEVYPLFLYHLLCSEYVVNTLNQFMKGDNSPSIRGGELEMCSVPLPPFAEQQRIVERIESLFEKLDAAKELVQDALDSFENRKAAILHKAFTGELSAKWREENGVSLESWEEKPLSELCDAFQYGTSKKSQEQGEVVVLRMGNLQKGEIDWKNLAYTSDKEDIEKYLLKEGDVLFNRTNSAELVGKTSIYRGEYPAIFAGYLIRLKYKPCLNGEYLNYVLNSPNAKAYCNEVKSDGVNQSNINAKKIGQFIIPVCKIEEQQEIVKIVSRLLDNEQQAEELCDIIEKIDVMKKSILARAFRGELGTNNPEEESAENLLREILIKRLQVNK